MISPEIVDVERAQQRWADMLISIGEAYTVNRDFQSVARLFVEKMYGYREGVVLFKPTCSNVFRPTAEGALSYFIGGDQEYPEDSGFALHPWKDVRFENAGYIFNKNQAVTMGHYYFTGLDGEELKVEFTIGWFRIRKGVLKIHLHHSSLPYSK